MDTIILIFNSFIGSNSSPHMNAGASLLRKDCDSMTHMRNELRRMYHGGKELKRMYHQKKETWSGLATYEKSNSILEYTWRQYNLSTNYRWDRYNTAEVIEKYLQETLTGHTNDTPLDGGAQVYTIASISGDNIILSGARTISSLSVGSFFYSLATADTGYKQRITKIVDGVRYRVCYATISIATGTFRRKSTYDSQVTSNSSTRYPNGGLSGSYWYENRTSYYVRGSYIKNVTSTNANAYSTNGATGSYWYDTRTSAYIKGSLIGNVEAEEGTYPANGRHTDGFWYVLIP